MYLAENMTMQALKTLIVDDEFNARTNLQLIIEDHAPELQVVGTTSSAEEARTMIAEQKPDVLLLDIMMPGENGFDLLESIDGNALSVVFVTAHNEFALRAFKNNAIDYLEKPIAIDELKRAVNKLVRLHGSANGSKERRNALERTRAVRKTMKDTISIPTRDGLLLLRSAEIVHLEASDSYTMIYTESGKKHLSSKNIRTYEDLLDPNAFMRVHRSYMINVRDHLKAFNRTEGNMAVMSNGAMVPVARRKLPEFLETVS